MWDAIKGFACTYQKDDTNFIPMVKRTGSVINYLDKSGSLQTLDWTTGMEYWTGMTFGPASIWWAIVYSQLPPSLNDVTRALDIATVDSPNEGHFWNWAFALHLEAVLWWEVRFSIEALASYSNFNRCYSQCPLFRGCPLAGGSIHEKHNAAFVELFGCLACTPNPLASATLNTPRAVLPL